MPDTLVKCSCCKEPTPSSKLKLVTCINGYVCQDCRRGLMVAEQELYKAGIPGIHRGPYAGTSNG